MAAGAPRHRAPVDVAPATVRGAPAGHVPALAGILSGCASPALYPALYPALCSALVSVALAPSGAVSPPPCL